MSITNKIKETIVSRAAEGLAVSVSVLVIWASSKITPIILPAIESKLSQKDAVSLLLASLALNIVFIILFWAFNKKPDLKLKYGIYWDKDKNPHCPNCKIPIAGYGYYQTGGTGYYCKPCKKIFPLQDAGGNNIPPEQAINEL